jgi:SAM-dependent methyltransferase
MDKRVYERMAQQEETHWWFVGRRAILSKVLERLALPENARILEVGAGTGGNLAMLQKFGQVLSIEPDPLARQLAAEKGQRAVLEGYLPDGLPKDIGQFDLVVMLDVLEHVEEDAESLAALKNYLKPRGQLLLTVPMFPFLWSAHDEVHHHKRRYRQQALLTMLGNAGYQTTGKGYFNFWLFPVAVILRFLKQLTGNQSSDDAQPAPWINLLLSKLFASEQYWVGKFSPPFGLSLWVAVKP